MTNNKEDLIKELVKLKEQYPEFKYLINVIINQVKNK